MQRPDAAAAAFAKEFNCCQSVVAAFADVLPFGLDAALKASCGFGGGMGRRQEVCGAVSGGVFVLGAVFGRGEHGDRSATERTYAKVRDLIIRFEGRQGCLECRDLLGGCDISTEAGHKHHVASGLRDRVCGSCVRTVAEIVEELLRAPPHPAAPKAP